MRETTAVCSSSAGDLPYFNPRPPCGRRRRTTAISNRIAIFQPTSPVRETTSAYRQRGNEGKISTHVPRAGDDLWGVFPCQGVHISTHVPRAGGDTSARTGRGVSENFNPRPPCGRRLLGYFSRLTSLLFQPTSPVRETTRKSGSPFWRCTYFNPRPPCGRRPTQEVSIAHLPRFQPTSPVRETTASDTISRLGVNISTHVPRAGDDERGGMASESK